MEPWRGTLSMCRLSIWDSGRDITSLQIMNMEHSIYAFMHAIDINGDGRLLSTYFFNEGISVIVTSPLKMDKMHFCKTIKKCNKEFSVKDPIYSFISPENEYFPA
jgi:hypothetical protein